MVKIKVLLKCNWFSIYAYLITYLYTAGMYKYLNNNEDRPTSIV